MKLTYFQLTSHLAKQLAPIYIISGDDILLKNDALSMLRKKCKQSGFTERVRLHPESSTRWGQLYSILNSNSLLAEKQLIEIDLRDSLPTKTATTTLAEYAIQPNPNVVLVIDINKIDTKMAKLAWLQALIKVGIHVTIWPLQREQLPRWIMDRARKYKLNIELNAATLLADYVEGNLVAAGQYLEKLYLLQFSGTIRVEQIQKIVADESRFTIFDLTNALVEQNASRALHILSSLQEEGVEPIMILWAITRELRTLAAMANEIEQGAALATIFQKFRIFSQRQSAIRKVLLKFKAEDYGYYLLTAGNIDRILKGGMLGNAWLALQNLCAQFTGLAAKGLY